MMNVVVAAAVMQNESMKKVENSAVRLAKVINSLATPEERAKTWNEIRWLKNKAQELVGVEHSSVISISKLLSDLSKQYEINTCLWCGIAVAESQWDTHTDGWKRCPSCGGN